MGPFFVYLLVGADGVRTYVGATNNLARRLRRHNGELSGGARYTRTNRPWRVAAFVTGFRTWRGCLQFERASKRGRGVGGRRAAMARLIVRPQPRKDYGSDPLAAWRVHV